MRRLELKTVEEIKAAIEAAVPGAGWRLCRIPARRRSTRCGSARARCSRWRTFLREIQSWRFDFLSNVTGVDWLDKEIAEKVK